MIWTSNNELNLGKQRRGEFTIDARLYGDKKVVPYARNQDQNQQYGKQGFASSVKVLSWIRYSLALFSTLFFTIAHFVVKYT